MYVYVIKCHVGVHVNILLFLFIAIRLALLVNVHVNIVLLCLIILLVPFVYDTILVHYRHVNICVVFFYLMYLHCLLFADMFCLLNSTENNKKRKFIRSATCCFISHFGMN